MKCRLLLFLFFIPVCLIRGYAQENPVYEDSVSVRGSNTALGPSGNAYVPTVIPPSPDAASLGRYGEIPVDLSRGSTSVSIPLYEIQSGSLKMPVSLNYHSGGVRVNDVSSSAGTS